MRGISRVQPKRALKLTDRDNVATMVEAVERGGSVAVQLGRQTTAVKAREEIPFGFKVAAADIRRGTHVIKYGESIGLASADIATGDLVHIHNLEGARGRGDLAQGGGTQAGGAQPASAPGASAHAAGTAGVSAPGANAHAAGTAGVSARGASARTSSTQRPRAQRGGPE